MDHQRRNFLTLLGLGAIAMTGCNAMSDKGYRYVGETRYNRNPAPPPSDGPVIAPYKRLDLQPAPAKPVATNGELLLTSAFSRDTWADAAPIDARLNPMQTPYRITLHHSGVFCEKDAKNDVVEILRGFRKHHLQHLGAGDIAYHYIIDRNGQVWLGRDLKYQGAHVRDNNEGNIGVMVMGNFEDQTPTRAQLETVNAVIPVLMERHKIQRGHVFTHRELMKTECPGRILQASFDGMRERRFA